MIILYFLNGSNSWRHFSRSVGGILLGMEEPFNGIFLYGCCSECEWVGWDLVLLISLSYEPYMREGVFLDNQFKSAYSVYYFIQLGQRAWGKFFFFSKRTYGCICLNNLVILAKQTGLFLDSTLRRYQKQCGYWGKMMSMKGRSFISLALTQKFLLSM